METPTTSQLLREARDLIADRLHWTRGTYARNIDGKPVNAHDPEACRFCAVGAVQRVFALRELSIYDTDGGSPYALACGALAEAVLGGGGSITAYNDQGGHEATLALFDCAIARLEAAA